MSLIDVRRPEFTFFFCLCLDYIDFKLRRYAVGIIPSFNSPKNRNKKSRNADQILSSYCLNQQNKRTKENKRKYFSSLLLNWMFLGIS